MKEEVCCINTTGTSGIANYVKRSMGQIESMKQVYVLFARRNQT